MGVSKSVFSLLKKVAESRNALRKHDGNRCRNITPLADHYVAFVAKRKRNFIPVQIAENIATATSTHVSARTISQRLNQVGLCAWKLIRCIPRQPRHRREGLRWCKEHVG
ncbi:hypothetical protein TNCV_3830961 [Trichonephila clavipes]|nr:hypothetical protein TNCV_3830961 [Trichonephila clavipes]